MSATTVATIPARHTPHTLLGTMRWLREDPERRRVVPRQYGAREMNLAEFRAWFMCALDAKITAAAPPRLNTRGVALRRLHHRAGHHPADEGAVERARRWRKDDADWDRSARCCARVVNTPRLAVHAQSIPMEFRARLAHRLHAETLSGASQGSSLPDEAMRGRSTRNTQRN